jgi:hypothetical protein
MANRASGQAVAPIIGIHGFEQGLALPLVLV